MNRDFNQYLKDYLELPFERIFEKYRHLKVMELVESANIGKKIKILEIGPGLNPVYTYLQGFEVVHVLEPIQTLYQTTQKNIKKKENIQVFNLTLDDFIKSNLKLRSYDLIILSSVLHEIPNYEEALQQCFFLLGKAGKIIIVVPNNKSLHRIIGEQSGIHPIGEILTTTEITMQQSASFSLDSLRTQLEKTGFETQLIKSEFIKIFPHSVMQELFDKSILNKQILDFFSVASPLLPDLGAEIFYLGTKL